MKPPAGADATLLQGELRLAGRLDARFFALLAALQAAGSIQRAARTAGYSYKGAWLALQAAGNLAHAPLFESRRRGGTTLTPAARALLQAWQRLCAAHAGFLREQEAALLQDPALAGLLRRLTMKTSARNAFHGTVARLVAGPVLTQVTLALPGGGGEIVAAVETPSVKALKLKKGAAAVALVKASAVVLVTDDAGFALSAANQLPGTVSRTERGAAASLVGLTLAGGQVLTASLTADSIAALGLAPGVAATAVFPASAVMLASEAA